MSKVLVVCARRYNGHELWTTLGILQIAGIEFEVVSTSRRIADEVTGQQNLIERTLDDVAPDEVKTFDGLMFVSGNMDDTEAYWSNTRTLAYVDAAAAAGIPLAAICCSVPIVRKAARGKRVSFYPLVRSRDLLELAGAIPTTVSVTIDGNLATAEHQMATQVWAEAFVKLVKGEKVDLSLVDSGFVPKGRTARSLPRNLEEMIYAPEELAEIDRRRAAKRT